jgi:hypothetical protein
MRYILYKTTNLINNKNYIGIHQTENINDGYLGSGISLIRAIKKYGKNNFSREILEECLSYDELLNREKFYVNEQWVNDKNNYNLKTGGQSNGFLSKESKNKISKTLKLKYKNGELKPRLTPPYIMNDSHKEKISNTLKEKYKLEVHNRKGTEPWNKGKVGLQNGWNKGLEMGPISDEHKQKISNTLKERYKVNQHNRKNVEPWNKGRTDLKGSWNKGLEMDKKECPHCGKYVDSGNAKRWHFEKCKFNQ